MMFCALGARTHIMDMHHNQRSRFGEPGWISSSTSTTLFYSNPLKSYVLDYVENAWFLRGACDFYKTVSVPAHSIRFHCGCCLPVYVWPSLSCGALPRTDVYRCCRIITTLPLTHHHMLPNATADPLFWFIWRANTGTRCRGLGTLWNSFTREGFSCFIFPKRRGRGRQLVPKLDFSSII